MGPLWVWADTTGRDGKVQAAKSSNYTVQFLADGKLSFKADCNTGSGAYKTSGNTMTITLGAMTMAACPPGSLADAYVKQLGSVAGYAITQTNLILTTRPDNALMRFTTTAAPAPTATVVAPATPLVPATTISPDKISVKTDGLGKTVRKTLVPATKYDKSMPPGPTGAPPHVVITGDGETVISIYPALDYVNLWSVAGDKSIENTVARLKQILAGRQTQQLAPGAPLPVLPPQFAYNDLACQFTYLDFPGGSGIRFVGRFVQDASPVTNAQLYYYFQGLTNDGKYYVSIMAPLDLKGLPDSSDKLPADIKAQSMQDFSKYLAGVALACQAANAKDFTPPLAQLDNMAKSVTIKP